LNSNFNQGAWMGANNKVAPSTSEIVTAQNKMMLASFTNMNNNDPINQQ